jgi:hypothetical protein
VGVAPGADWRGLEATPGAGGRGAMLDEFAVGSSGTTGLLARRASRRLLVSHVGGFRRVSGDEDSSSVTVTFVVGGGSQSGTTDERSGGA